MDFERIAARSLFYDMPVEVAVKRIRKGDSKGFLDDFCMVARWIDESFTVSEIELLKRGMDQSWIKVDERALINEPSYKRCLVLFNRIGQLLLKMDRGGIPIVEFSKLLRWRSMTRYLGEDVLTTSYTAFYDFYHHLERSNFCWPDVIHHNQYDLNEELSKGLSEVHAHYKASVSVFSLNWISMMNTISIDNDYRFMQQPQSTFFDMSEHYDMKMLSLVACFLRLGLYKVVLLDYPINKTNLFDVWRVFDDLKFRNDQIGDLRAEVAVLLERSYQGSCGYPIDYAISGKDITDTNIYILHYGERKLFYSVFKRLLEGNAKAWEIAGLFYLYILIKNKVRREFEQTNGLNGFKNFRYYQDRKNQITKRHCAFHKNYSRFVIQTCLENDNDLLEIRTMGKVDFTLFKHAHFSIDTGENAVPDIHDRLSFVVSFGKEEYDKQLSHNNTIRYCALRDQVKKEYLRLYNQCSKQMPFKITGIDAAGNELQCRPEVFSHVYRYAQYMGMHGLTYHVGEDFYDLIDGLRAIDEAIRFLNLGNRSRLGHALALAVDPDKYYSRRRMNAMLPRQNLLDNLVWFHHVIRKEDVPVPQSLLLYLEEKSMSLACEIGYKSFNLISYWNSWLLRGDDYLESDATRPYDGWSATSESNDKSTLAARKDELAKKLYRNYLIDMNIKKNGNVIVEEKLPLSLVSVTPIIQTAMMRKIEEKGIAIECNPTSNLQIGPFEKYIDLPLLKFMPIENDERSIAINASVNTDDRGIFATSIYNEYSLIAAALYKLKDEEGNRRYNDQTILNYIRKIRENGFKQRF